MKNGGIYRNSQIHNLDDSSNNLKTGRAKFFLGVSFFLSPEWPPSTLTLTHLSLSLSPCYSPFFSFCWFQAAKQALPSLGIVNLQKHPHCHSCVSEQLCSQQIHRVVKFMDRTSKKKKKKEKREISRKMGSSCFNSWRVTFLFFSFLFCIAG